MIKGQSSKFGESVYGEIGAIGAFASDQSSQQGANSTNSTFSPYTHSQKAVFPEDSILADFYALAVTMTEGADCYVIASILPVCAAILGRDVWLPWLAGSLYP